MEKSRNNNGVREGFLEHDLGLCVRQWKLWKFHSCQSFSFLVASIVISSRKAIYKYWLRLIKCKVSQLATGDKRFKWFLQKEINRYSSISLCWLPGKAPQRIHNCWASLYPLIWDMQLVSRNAKIPGPGSRILKMANNKREVFFFFFLMHLCS